MTKKIALVTGGLGGIGQEICAQLGKAGYVVVSTYMRAGRDEAWVKQLKDLGVEAKAYQCDVANLTMPKPWWPTSKKTLAAMSVCWLTTPASPKTAP